MISPFFLTDTYIRHAFALEGAKPPFVSIKRGKPVKLATNCFNDEELTDLNNTVAATSCRTSARIAPVVASASAAYDRAEDMLGFWAAALGLALLWMLFSFAPVSDGIPLIGQVNTGGLAPVIGTITTGFIAGALLATKMSAIRRPFVSKNHMAEAVKKRAGQAFAAHYLHKRSGDISGNLLVIYISLYEKSAIVHTDERLTRLLTAGERRAIEDLVAVGFAKGGSLATSISDAVDHAAEILAPHCPLEKVEADEPIRPVAVSLID